MFNINFADDWIRTADLWYRKQLLFQLSHNHCPDIVSSFNLLVMLLDALFFSQFYSFCFTVKTFPILSPRGNRGIRTHDLEDKEQKRSLNLRFCGYYGFYLDFHCLPLNLLVCLFCSPGSSFFITAFHFYLVSSSCELFLTLSLCMFVMFVSNSLSLFLSIPKTLHHNHFTEPIIVIYYFIYGTPPSSSLSYLKPLLSVTKRLLLQP